VLAAGLSMRWIVVPEVISYSFNNFVSVRAFPLTSNRCVSTGGAESDDLAISDFRSEIVSVSCTVSGIVKAGFKDLIITSTEESACKSSQVQLIPRTPHLPCAFVGSTSIISGGEAISV
jgi:hypothetical protein